MGFALLALILAETTLRKAGVAPSLSDDRALWCLQRERAWGGRKTLALVGASHVQLGIVPSVIESRLPGIRVAQLAIDGTNPVATLRDLARDPSFEGVALVTCLPFGLYEGSWNDQEPWVRYFHDRWGINQRLNRKLAALLQEELVVAGNALAPRQCFRHFVEGKPFEPTRNRIFADRHREIDYGGMDRAELQAQRLELDRGSIDLVVDEATRDAWLASLRKLAPVIAELRSHGGDVVILHALLSGRYREVYDRHFPRELYWDRIAGELGVSAFHPDDEPALRAFECPDGSHLDRRDAPAFTAALVDLLEREGVLSGR